MIKPGTRLQHYKNLPYQFLFYARHSETLEEVAVYECLYPNPKGTHWVRPRPMFDEVIPGSEPPVQRFAPVLDQDGQVERMSSCSAEQEKGLAGRYNMRCWHILDRWSRTQVTDTEQTEALELAYAALAATRHRGTPLEVARCHWLVALVLLRMGNTELAAVHVRANQNLIEESEVASGLDHALGLELQARLASVAHKTQREVSALKARARQAFESLEDEQERERCLHFFEEPPW
jgi:hypothetical protein